MTKELTGSNIREVRVKMNSRTLMYGSTFIAAGLMALHAIGGWPEAAFGFAVATLHGVMAILWMERARTLAGELVKRDPWRCNSCGKQTSSVFDGMCRSCYDDERARRRGLL